MTLGVLKQTMDDGKQFFARNRFNKASVRQRGRRTGFRRSDVRLTGAESTLLDV
jgi:hypothetical protein